MPRVKRSTNRRDSRRKTLKLAQGYFLTKSKLYRAAQEAVEKARKQIAELIAQCIHVLAFDRIRDLVRFFDRVRRDRRERLLLIPRAATLRIAQTRHDVEKTLNR